MAVFYFDQGRHNHPFALSRLFVSHAARLCSPGWIDLRVKTLHIELPVVGCLALKYSAIEHFVQRQGHLGFLLSQVEGYETALSCWICGIEICQRWGKASLLPLQLFFLLFRWCDQVMHLNSFLHVRLSNVLVVAVFRLFPTVKRTLVLHNLTANWAFLLDLIKYVFGAQFTWVLLNTRLTFLHDLMWS